MAINVDLNFDDTDEPTYYVVEQDVTICIPYEDTVGCDWKENQITYIDSLLVENNQRENPIPHPRLVELFDGSDSIIIAMVSDDLYESLIEYM